MGYRPRLMIIDEVARIPDEVFVAAAKAYNAPKARTCPDCESHWDQSAEDVCATCGLSIDDLAARLERRTT